LYPTQGVEDSVTATWQDAIAEATTRLSNARLPSPRVDAELLAAHVVGLPRGRLSAAGPLTADQAGRYRRLVADRAAHVPLQYLTGKAPFRQLELVVGPGVFVPRPETELLVEWGLRWLAANGPGLVVDLCSGSGAIAIAVATEASGNRVVAVEDDPHALEWLRRNASPYDVSIVEGDATASGTLGDRDGTVDLVLCNPPYVPEIGAAGLPPEVTEHDPHRAVFGGRDGLDVVRPVLHRIGDLLRPGGAFAMEHDDTHAYVVPTLVDADARFTGVALHHDLAGRPRFTTATRTDRGDRVADLRS
jgi:release factor glutamine methyltransferase